MTGRFTTAVWSPGAGATRRPRVAAVILAAGASSRFHGFPKACLRVGGESAVRRIVRLALNAGCSPVVVVAGPHEPEIARTLEGSPVRLVRNPEWARGRTGSVQVGLREVPSGDDVLLWPVDHPFVDAKSLSALADARERDALAVWFIPMYLGQGGHPVLVRSVAVPVISELSAHDPLRTVHPKLGAQVRRVVVSDPGVTEDVNSPQEFELFSRQWEARWTGD